eukprot:CAMPEP_0178370944 /NCGR_PEP_ID=MMETSP0689_2-20121128/567_1 /TAXON_ID=160604 /ORGANISM="Amphidinium massartii, Strain CS-259" /LENGTH=222 /DNA_ID=CAMNT_0019990789 /DNA_START=17 /DNA_END=683 /DNA_ORIENTATION=-
MGCCLRKQQHSGDPSKQQIDFPVTVHVYSLINEQGNFLLTAMTGGGVYHSGTEINNYEYAFGGFAENELLENGEPRPERAGRSGVWKQKPKELPPQMRAATHYRAIEMGTVRCSKEQLNGKLAKLSREWKAIDYDVLQKNCNHFTHTLCEVLEVQAPPPWINELADRGVSVARVIGNISSVIGRMSQSASQGPSPEKTSAPSPASPRSSAQSDVGAASEESP